MIHCTLMMFAVLFNSCFDVVVEYSLMIQHQTVAALFSDHKLH